MQAATARYKARLQASLGSDWLDGSRRREVIARIRGFLDDGRAELAAEFELKPTGEAYCQGHSALFDSVLSACFDLALSTVERREGPLPMDADLCVVAIGGYGRAHLAPWSDIDLAFVPMIEEHEHIDAIIREMLAVLDELLVPLQHPHVAHSYRPLADLAYIDYQSATALLESRFVAGDMSLYMHLMQAVIASMSPVDFAYFNMLERQEIWNSRRQSLYAVEPLLKTGPGGLRDFHAAVWVAKVVYRLHDWDVLGALRQRGIISERDEKAALAGLEYVLRVRNWLHLHRGTKLDTLHKGYQQDLALALGYRDHGRVAASEDMMRELYAAMRAMADFSRRLLMVCREERMEFRHGCLVERWQLEPGHDTVFTEDPARLVELFADAQALDLTMSVRLQRQIVSHAHLVDESVVARRDVGEAMIRVLRPEADVSKTLRQMLNMQILERVLPDFGPLLTFLPSDQAHEYTVGEHSLKVVDELQRLALAPNGEDEKILSDALAHLQEPEVLIFAGLFHDVGKLDGTGAHSLTGIIRAREAAERLGLQEHQIARVSFLIREHLTMMRTARLKPLQLQDTIEEFVDCLPAEDPLDALDMLTLLTYADTRSVGQNVLKDTDRRLLMDLFGKAARWIQERPLLEGGASEQAGRARRRLTRAPALKDLDPEVVRAHLERLPVWYAVNTQPAVVAKHIDHLARLSHSDGPVIDYHQSLGAKHTEMTLCTTHRPYLLRDIAGAIAANNLDIYLCSQEVALAQGEDVPRQAICTIWLDDFGQSVTQPKRDRLAEDLASVLRGDETVAELLVRRGRGPADVVVHSVEVSNEASRQYTVVSIRAADERGLLFRLADTLASEALDIRVAKVTTWRSAAEDAFYVVSTQTGAKLSNEQTNGLADRLLDDLGGRPLSESGAYI